MHSKVGEFHVLSEFHAVELLLVGREQGMAFENVLQLNLGGLARVRLLLNHGVELGQVEYGIRWVRPERISCQAYDRVWRYLHVDDD